MELILFIILFSFCAAFFIAVFMLPFKIIDILRELKEIHACIDEYVDRSVDTVDEKLQKDRQK